MIAKVEKTFTVVLELNEVEARSLRSQFQSYVGGVTESQVDYDVRCDLLENLSEVLD